MIGEEVRRRREGLGLTGAQLATRAGMAPSAVSQIETGKRTPSSASVVKLAYALGVEVGQLYPKEQARLPLEDVVSLPLDIDELKKEVIREARPANQIDLQTAVEDKIEQSYSREELFLLKDELEELRQAISPTKEDELNAYAQVLEARNYVHRVLHRITSPQLAGPVEEENEQ
jgi:transcriptional regulator with XRE-family HTH domain